VGQNSAVREVAGRMKPVLAVSWDRSRSSSDIMSSAFKWVLGVRLGLGGMNGFREVPVRFRVLL
jgi:hypothetical protein